MGIKNFVKNKARMAKAARKAMPSGQFCVLMG